MDSVVLRLLLAFSICLLVSSNPTGRIPTVYDVLQLVYQVCSTDDFQRPERLSCVSSHMGKEIEVAVEQCMVSRNDSNETYSSVHEFCEQLTHVREWAATHGSPPPQLTRVMGLAALGRMACVLGEVQRPLPMWQAAFAKCFTEYQSASSIRKEGLRNRSANALDIDDE